MFAVFFDPLFFIDLYGTQTSSRFPSDEEKTQSWGTKASRKLEGEILNECWLYQKKLVVFRVGGIFSKNFQTIQIHFAR